jgi:hypothetical protein
MAAPKRTKLERERDLLEVARLDRRGYTEREIARILNVSHSQVTYDKKKLTKRYQSSQQLERIAYDEEAVARLRDCLAEIWEAWDGSKVMTRVIDKVEVTLPANPEPRYMDLLLECLHEVHRNRGILPEKLGPNINNLNGIVQLDWATLTADGPDGSGSGNQPNAIDAKLAEVEQQPKGRPRIGLHELSKGANGNEQPPPPPKGA